MDFAISDKMKTILEMVDEFVEKELIPLEPELAGAGFREMLPKIREKQKKVRQMELWAPNFPKDCGGLGLSLVEHGLLSEALGRTPLGHFVFWCQAPDAGNVEILHLHGTEEQKEKYLKPLVAGDIRSCFSMTEVDMPGSNPVLLETTAVKDGNDYVINGHKWYTSSADGADFAIVMAVTNPEAPDYMQASMIIVPTDAPGFNLVRNIPVMGHAGEDYFSHAEILYQSCRVPQSNLLGPEGHGFIIAQERLGPGRIHHCMRWLGICQRSFELMGRRANSRKIPRDGKPLASRQIIQAWVAESAAEIQAARLMTLHAAWRIDQEGAKAARDDISMIKTAVPNVTLKIIDEAIQMHGGLGVSQDTPLAEMYMGQRTLRLADGPDAVHRMVVGRHEFKKYLEQEPVNAAFRDA
jgi:alkylation response protein AidB-like acyl-CoA dehydrogenase